jgi:hypothetical protein
MKARLKIHFDGTASGLAEHRLDLTIFGEAIAALTTGIRRTASAIVKAAAETPAVGRLNRKAELHVFLEGLLEGSLGLAVAVEPPPLVSGENVDLYLDDLPVRATKKFIGEVLNESKGLYRDSAARKFLQAMPAGVALQRYEVYSGDLSVLDVTIGAVELPPEPVALPSVIRTSARIVGLTFEPHTEVRFDAGGSKFSCSAPDALMKKAIALYENEVGIVAVVTGPSKGRLLWLSTKEECPPTLERGQVGKYVLDRWATTLEILGR